MSAINEKKPLYDSGYPKEMVRNKYGLLVSERLKIARDKKGISLANAVKELKQRGVKTGVSTIQGYEVKESNINHRYPSLVMLLHVAKLYDCSIDYLFGLTDQINVMSNDYHNNLTNSQAPLFWDGKEISEAQKGLIIEKINSIMDL